MGGGQGEPEGRGIEGGTAHRPAAVQPGHVHLLQGRPAGQIFPTIYVRFFLLFFVNFDVKYIRLRDWRFDLDLFWTC